jgi:hypothetical protein
VARLRNRIRKADYFTDGELLRWHRDKRTTYSGLWALAEDSGCLEDDQFEWKLSLWPSPLDSDITIELLEQWRDEYVAAGKLVPYDQDGKRYLYIRTFHQHEHPRNPQPPDLPLPTWVSVDVTEGVSKDGRRWVRAVYSDASAAVQTRSGNADGSVALPRSGTDRNGPKRSNPTGKDLIDFDDDFAQWWEASGKNGSKADARLLYGHWRKTASRDDLLTAVVKYRRHCETSETPLKHGCTFLAKKPNRWREWLDPTAHAPARGNGKPSAPPRQSCKCGTYLTPNEKGVLQCPMCD